jgi:hypothetical protein
MHRGKGLDVKAYKGVVYSQSASDMFLRANHFGLPVSVSPGLRPVGEARITFYNDGHHAGHVSPFSSSTLQQDGHIHVPFFSRPVFEGHFEVDGTVFNVQPIEIYHASKRPDDPHIPTPSSRHPAHQDASVIVYRDNDRRGFNPDNLKQKPAECAADKLDFNRRQIEKIKNMASPHLTKRQEPGCSPTTKIAYLVSTTHLRIWFPL